MDFLLHQPPLVEALNTLLKMEELVDLHLLLKTVLQQGVVDGGESPFSDIYTKKFHEVATSITISNHGYLGYLVVMSKKFWDDFPAELKPKIMQAMKEATALNRKLAAELKVGYLAKIQAYADKTGKLKIYTLTPEQKDAWRKATSVIYPEFYDTIGEDLIKKAQK